VTECLGSSRDRKARGCEYAGVVIPVTTQHDPMLQRNLIYTGITHGRTLVVLVAQKKALAVGIGQPEGLTSTPSNSPTATRGRQILPP